MNRLRKIALGFIFLLCPAIFSNVISVSAAHAVDVDWGQWQRALRCLDVAEFLDVDVEFSVADGSVYCNYY